MQTQQLCLALFFHHAGQNYPAVCLSLPLNCKPLKWPELWILYLEAPCLLAQCLTHSRWPHVYRPELETGSSRNGLQLGGAYLVNGRQERGMQSLPSSPRDQRPHRGQGPHHGLSSMSARVTDQRRQMLAMTILWKKGF